MKYTFSITFMLTLLLIFSNCNTTKKSIEENPVTTSPSPSIAAPHFEKLTFDNFDKIMKEGEGLQLAYFWASWCGPCRTISPAMDNLSRNYAGQLTIGKLDVDAEKITADLNGVTGIPAFLFFKNGELVFKTSGLVTEQYLINVIERLL